MERICNYLFVYGTLLQKENKFAAYLNKNAVHHGNAQVKGLMYDMGLFPGAILTERKNCVIKGTIVYMSDPETVLKELDPYEGFGPKEPQPNMFTRELIEIENDGIKLDCWIYLYNLPVSSYYQITSGDYLAHLNLKNKAL